MAKSLVAVGYVHDSVEKAAGVWENDIVEHTFRADILRNTRTLLNDAKVNDDLTVGNSISIVADSHARDNYFAIRYVRWAGALWKVTEVEVQSPRLLLRLGGVYNGPTAETPNPA